MFTIKVGVMPGRLQEVVASEGITAREIFELAEVTVSNHEVRLDGEVINMDDALGGGRLLVAMKQIKGNMATVKVGTMPGKLHELECSETDTPRQLFERAGITISNHEIRLDGAVIDIDDPIDNGRLLVSMKQIKGNSDCAASDKEAMYVSSLTEEEIEILTGSKLPTVIKEEDVELLDDCVIITDMYLIENDVFFSIYARREVETEDTFMKSFQAVLDKQNIFAEPTSLKIEPSMFAGVPTIQVGEHVCTCKNAIKIIEDKIGLVKSDLNYYDEIIGKKRAELYILQDVLMEIK